MLTTITFGDRPSSQVKNVLRDTWLEQAQPSFNYGAAPDVSLGRFAPQGEHALLRFDLGSLAPGTQIGVAQLSMYRIDYGDELLGPIEMHLLAESWIEGTNDGAPGTGASWTTRDGSTAWATGGGTTSQLLATVTPTDTEVVLPIPADIVARWIDDPASNFGILLRMPINGTHLHLGSRESTTAGRARRPELSVTIVQ